MPGGAHRVAHIVETIEKANEIVVMAGVVLGRCLREGHALRYPPSAARCVAVAMEGA